MTDSTQVVIDSTQVHKPMQFKIETPIVTVESDTDNHLVDVISVVAVVIGCYVAFKVFRKWIKSF